MIFFKNRWRKKTIRKIESGEMTLDDLSEDEFDELVTPYYIKIANKMEQLYETNPEQFISADEFFERLDALPARKEQ